MDQETLKSLVRYDPETGNFFWLKRSPELFEPTLNMTKEDRCRAWNSRCEGKIAGVFSKSTGYWYLTFFGKKYGAHRMAFLYMEGRLPIEVDHENGVRVDNRWENLREVTRAENTWNLKIRSNNTTGIMGVSFNNRGFYEAYISKNKRRKFLGYFNNIDDAAKARQKAEKELGFHENHGKR